MKRAYCGKEARAGLTFFLDEPQDLLSMLLPLHASLCDRVLQGAPNFLQTVCTSRCKCVRISSSMRLRTYCHCIFHCMPSHATVAQYPNLSKTFCNSMRAIVRLPVCPARHASACDRVFQSAPKFPQNFTKGTHKSCLYPSVSHFIPLCQCVRHGAKSSRSANEHA